MRKGHKVRVLDNLSKPEALEISRQAEFHLGDIREPGAVRNVMAGVDCVFHLAAISSIPECLKRPGESWSVNVLGTRNVLEHALSSGVRRLVFASSCAAQDITSPYAAHKSICEKMCAWYTRNTTLQAICLRYYNVYGATQSEGVIPSFIRALMRGEPLLVYGDGHQTRDFIHVSDVVQATYKAADSQIPAAGFALDIGTGQSTELLELLSALESITGIKARPVFMHERPGEIRHSRADIRYAHHLLGFVPRIRLDAGLRSAVARQRRRA